MVNRLEKICHCSILHKLDDSRIFYKECVSLSYAGYNVTFIAQKGSKKNFDNKIYKNVYLIKLSDSNRIFNHFKLLYLILKNNFKVIHFHDPELIIIGLILVIFKKRVIYDAHENLRQSIMHKFWVIPSLRWSVSRIAIFFEKLADTYFNAIITATPMIASNFSNKNLLTIKNYPILSNDTFIRNSLPDKKIIIYIGTLSQARGIKELIKSTELLNGYVELWLLGNWSENRFKIECESLKGYNFTKYLGLVNHEKIPFFLSQSSIGLCTLHPINTFLDSYPIKVFEYLQYGLPVIASNFKMWNQMFGNTCEYVNPLNTKEIAEKIFNLLQNPLRLMEMNKKGIELVKSEYNWNSENFKLLDLYSKVIK